MRDAERGGDIGRGRSANGRMAPAKPVTVDEYIEAAGLETTPHTVQFRYGEPVPVDVVGRVAAHREHDVRENDARWAGVS